MECLRLRAGDIDFSRHTVRVHAGKGGKDRITVLPESLVEPLEMQLAYVRAIHQQDLANGLGEARLSRLLRRKFGKSSQRFYWQFLFPGKNISADPREPDDFTSFYFTGPGHLFDPQKKISYRKSRACR